MCPLFSSKKQQQQKNLSFTVAALNGSDWGKSVNIKILSIVRPQDVNNMGVNIFRVEKILSTKLHPILQLCCYDNAMPQTLKF